MTRLEYEITAMRVDAHASVVRCKEAEIVCDTDVQGRVDAFNPAELLLAAVAACILKNMERIAPIIHFDYRGVSVRVKGVRQDAPPKMLRRQEEPNYPVCYGKVTRESTGLQGRGNRAEIQLSSWWMR